MSKSMTTTVLSTIQPTQLQPLSVDVDNWSSRFAKADWLLAGDPVCGDDDVDFLTHPIEARTITSDEVHIGTLSNRVTRVDMFGRVCSLAQSSPLNNPS